jgi:prevent-host-death family protein
VTWAATQAKAKFSEVLDRAESEGPQVVRRRKHEFVLMKKEEYEALPKAARLLRNRKSRVPKEYENLAEFFRNSPLLNSEIELKRVKLKPRRVEF